MTNEWFACGIASSLVLFLVWRPILQTMLMRKEGWCWKNRWTEVWHHRCAVCQETLSDPAAGTGFFQDYVCSKGHYELHFDCGGFKARVGKLEFSFWESEYEKGFADIAKAAEELRDIESDAWPEFKQFYQC